MGQEAKGIAQSGDPFSLYRLDTLKFPVTILGSIVFGTTGGLGRNELPNRLFLVF